MKFRLVAFIFGLLFSLNGISQTTPFNIVLEPINVSELGGLQSFAFGQHNGKWLIVGGRLDGLHRRQPFASFDRAGHNNQLFVIDPVTKKRWTAPLTSLSAQLQEQLQSTNMEYYQTGNFLYLVGGYGYSAIEGDHTTFGNLTAIDVPKVIEAIIKGTSFTTCFRQIADPQFQVTGGGLEKINGTYYLVGGQKFIGRYNPMGPNHGPGFFQEYTNQIRKFTLLDNGKTINISHLPAETDSVNLHRRDYNVTAQIMANGQEGITAFSGVFQANINLPFLNSVNIDRSGYIVNNSFSQYYNNYQCADVPLYSALNNEMHTLFFGGIAQYCDSSGILVQNNNVSFVKTISRVTRTSIGTMTEYKLPVQMPDFMGAGSEFIPIETISRYGNGVIKLDDLKDDATVIGYIYGGINSTAENIFWINNGNQSTASPLIFKVLLTKNGSKVPHHKNEQSTGTLKMMAYPDPYNDNFIVTYNLKQMSEVKLSLISIDGIKVEDTVFKKQPVGENTFEKKITNLSKGGTFLLTIDAGYEKAVQKIIVEP